MLTGFAGKPHGDCPLSQSMLQTKAGIAATAYAHSSFPVKPLALVSSGRCWRGQLRPSRRETGRDFEGRSPPTSSVDDPMHPARLHDVQGKHPFQHEGKVSWLFGQPAPTNQ
jgi:hypothetical protein